MIVTIRERNIDTGEAVVTGFQGDQLIAALSTNRGLFRLGIGNDPGFDAGRALVADWRARGDAIEVIV